MQSESFASGDTRLRNWRPSEYLAHAEASANRIRKLLACLPDRDGHSNPASHVDAERLAKLVEELARHGQSQSAMVAAEIAERVEPLLTLLANEISELLSAGR
jgi:hypothetical protein